MKIGSIIVKNQIEDRMEILESARSAGCGIPTGSRAVTVAAPGPGEMRIDSWDVSIVRIKANSRADTDSRRWVDETGQPESLERRLTRWHLRAQAD